MKAISKQQITIIHVGKAQLGIPEDVYRDMLAKYGVTSSTGLTFDQATGLIDDLKKIGFRPLSKQPTPPARCPVCTPRPPREEIPDNVVYLVSPQQLRRIDQLKADIQWRTWDGYQRWLLKYFGLAIIKYSTEASAVIEGLKGLWRSQNGCTNRKRKDCDRAV